MLEKVPWAWTQTPAILPQSPWTSRERWEMWLPPQEVEQADRAELQDTLRPAIPTEQRKFISPGNPTTTHGGSTPSPLVTGDGAGTS